MPRSRSSTTWRAPAPSPRTFPPPWWTPSSTCTSAVTIITRRWSPTRPSSSGCTPTNIARSCSGCSSSPTWSPHPRLSACRSGPWSSTPQAPPLPPPPRRASWCTRASEAARRGALGRRAAGLSAPTPWPWRSRASAARPRKPGRTWLQPGRMLGGCGGTWTGSNTTRCCTGLRSTTSRIFAGSSCSFEPTRPPETTRAKRRWTTRRPRAIAATRPCLHSARHSARCPGWTR
mmetsp:Transcript_43056/g.138407  ORF Transcript_43056/g.138407 Transcript_43056/m.138407 type:complete len:232 (+) Transcript_43056:776-1471(+)